MVASRFNKVFIAVAIAVSLLSTMPTFAQSGNCTQIATGPLNLRAGPTQSANVLAVIEAGNTVEFVSQSSDWIEVKLDNGLSGWASADFLACTSAVSTDTTAAEAADITEDVASSDAASSEQVTTASAVCTVNEGVNVNVRNAPSADGDWVVTLTGGSTATGLALNDAGTWRELQLADGTTGWSSVNFLSCTEVETAVQSAVEATATPLGANLAGSHGLLCVYAYQDINGNRMYDAGTEGVPQAIGFTIRDTAVSVAPSAEEGCFTVASGNHVIDLAATANQQPDEGASWLVSVPVDRKMKLWVSLSEQQINEVVTADEMIQPTAEPTPEPVNLTFRDYQNAVPVTWWRYIIGSAVGIAVLALAALIVKLRGGIGKIADTDIVAMADE